MNIFAAAAKLEQQNQPFAFVQIIASRGSTPRHTGQMLVLSDGRIIGTIGGGRVERNVIDQAQQAITERKPRVFHGRMTRTGANAVGSDCGGAMSVYIDVHGLRPRLILLGAGHVNQAIARAALPLGFDIHVADTYPASLQAQHFPPGCHLLLADTFTEAIRQLDPDQHSYLIIATHNQDQEALDCLIEHPLAYLGLLASRRKVQTFSDALSQRGIARQHLQRLYAPIGFNIGAETPDEIAVSVMAEILRVKNQASGRPMRDDQPLSHNQRVVIRGAGDIASGVALRLHHSGFQVIMLDLPQPTVIRRSVAFAQAVYDGEFTLEGVTARKVDQVKDALALLDEGIIPILIDPTCRHLAALQPRFLIDAILAKHNLGTHQAMAPITLALGPGFNAGVDCDAVIETHRGHTLGRVIYQGFTQDNTGVPGSVAGHSAHRVIRAPVTGIMHCQVRLGDLVTEGDLFAHIDQHPVYAPLSGMVRGLLHEGLPVTEGVKIGDIDPRGIAADYLTVSDKARAIAGAVLEAMLHLNPH